VRKVILLCVIVLIFNSCESTNYPSIRSTSLPSNNVSNSQNNFEVLIAKDKIGKLQRNGEIVNQLLNEQPSDRSAAITIENTTNCNIIVRISGVKNYLLPIYKNDKNFILIDKGSYTFSSDFCRAKYYKQKSITESVVITLSEH
jgi:hypothetical protein